jgi:hypothetical protein
METEGCKRRETRFAKEHNGEDPILRETRFAKEHNGVGSHTP